MKAYARVALLSTVGACSPPSTDPEPIAIGELSRVYIRPEERITATVRADLSAYAIDRSSQAPPADVAADRQRLAGWKANEEKQYGSAP